MMNTESNKIIYRHVSRLKGGEWITSRHYHKYYDIALGVARRMQHDFDVAILKIAFDGRNETLIECIEQF